MSSGGAVLHPSPTGTTFDLSLEEGQGLVTRVQAPDAAALTLTRLELGLDQLQFPTTEAASPGAYRHRRLALGKAEVLCQLRPLCDGASAPLAKYGFRLHRIAIGDDATQLTLAGEAFVGSERTEFVFGGLLQASGRELCLRLVDLALFLPFQIAAPLVAGGLLRSLATLAARPAFKPLVTCDSLTTLRADVLGLALRSSLPPAGWRLPVLDSSVGVWREHAEGEALLLRFFTDKSGDAAAAPLGACSQAYAARLAEAAAFSALDCQLRDQPLSASIDAYQRSFDSHPDQVHLGERLLQLMLAQERYHERALRFSQELEALLPHSTVPALAQATLARLRGEGSAAKGKLLEVAARYLQAGCSLSAAYAQASAAAAILPTQAREAITLYEQALELEPEHAGALAGLARLYADQSSWHDLAAIRRRQVTLAPPGEVRLHALLALGELQRVHLADPVQARQHYLAALAIDPHCEPALRGLAEAAIDADDPLQAMSALDTLAELAERSGDEATVVALHLRIAALWEHLEDLERAHARLLAARQLRPADQQLLQRSAEVLDRQGRHEDASVLYLELLEQLSAAEERLVIHRKLARLYLGPLTDLSRAAQQLSRALALDMMDAQSLVLRVQLAREQGEPAELATALLQASTPEELEPDERAAFLIEYASLVGDDPEGDAPAAEEALDRASLLATDPRSALIALAELRHRRGATAQAAEAWVAATTSVRGAEDPRCWLGLGAALGRLEAWERSKEAFEHVLALNPAPAQLRAALSALAAAYNALDQRHEEARVLALHAELLAQQGADRPFATIAARLAEVHLELGQGQAAGLWIERAIEAKPDEADYYALAGSIRAEAADWEGATKAYRGALQRYQHHGQVEAAARMALHLGRVAGEAGHPRAAADHYREALAGPLSREQQLIAWKQLVRLELRSGDAAAAAEACERSAELPVEAEERAQRLFEAGQLWLKRANEPQRAREAFWAALKDNPRHPRCLDALEALAKQQGDREQLIDVLERKVEASAPHPQIQKAVLARLAELLAESGQPERAGSAATQALLTDPNYLPALLFEARVAWQRGDWQVAERRYQQVIDRLDSTAVLPAERSTIAIESHLKLAQRCYSSGHTGRCEAQLRALLALAPQHAEANQQLEHLLSHQGRIDELVAHGEQRIETASGAEALALRLAQARRLTEYDRPAEARAHYLTLLDLEPTHPAISELDPLCESEATRQELYTRYRRCIEALAAQADTVSRRCELWQRVAELANGLDEPARAAAAWHEVLALAPAKVEAVEGLLQLSHRGVTDQERGELFGLRLRAEQDLGLRQALLDEVVYRLRESRDDPQAIELLRSALGEGWATSKQGETLAQLLVLRGERGEARDIYQRLQRGPDAEAASRACARLLELALGDPPEQRSVEELRSLSTTLRGAPPQGLAPALMIEALRASEQWNELAAFVEAQLQGPDGANPELATKLRCELARALARGGRASEASATLSAALHAAPLGSLAGLAQCAAELDLQAVEREALTRYFSANSDSAIDLEAGAVRLRLRAAELLCEQDPPAAAELLQPLLAAEPALQQEAAQRLMAMTGIDPTIRLEASFTLYRGGELGPPQAWELALALAEHRRPHEALTIARACRALTPPEKQGEVDAFIRELLAQTGDFEALACAYEDLGRESPPARRAGYFLEAAQLWLEKIGEVERGGNCLRWAAEQTPDRRDAIVAATALFGAMNAWEEGTRVLIALAEPSRASKPALQADALTAAAQLSEHRAPISRAIELYWEALSRHKRHQPALTALARLLGEAGDQAGLLTVYLRQAELGPVVERAAALAAAIECLAAQGGDPKEAVALAARAQKLGANAELRQRLAEALSVVGALEEAESLWVALADEGASAELALGRAARIARQLQAPEREASYLARIDALRPLDQAQRERLVAAYQASGDYQALRQTLETALADDPKAGLKLGQLCLEVFDDAAAALDAFVRYLAIDPNERQALEGLIRAAESLGRNEELLWALQQMRRLLPESANAQRALLTLRIGTLLLEGARGAEETLEPALVELDAARKALRSGPAWAEATRLLLGSVDASRQLMLLSELAEQSEATAAEYARLAALAQGAGQIDLALASLQRHLEHDPESVELETLVELLSQQGRRAEARDLLGGRAGAALARGDRALAREYFLQLADRCSEPGEQAPRVAALRRALVASPERLEVAERLVEQLRSHGDAATCLELLAPLVPMVPSAIQALLLDELALAHQTLGHRHEALQAREERFRIAPDQGPLALELLRTALESNDLKRARYYFDRLERSARLRELPAAEAAQLCVALGSLELESEREVSARALCARALRLCPGQREALLLAERVARYANDARTVCEARLTLAHRSEGETRTAYLEQALEAICVLPDARHEAIAVCRELLEHQPHSEHGQRRLVALLRAIGDDRGLATALWQQVDQAQTPALELLMELASLERQLGRYDAAERALRQARTLRPDDPLLLDELCGVVSGQHGSPAVAALLQEEFAATYWQAPQRAQLAMQLGALYAGPLAQQAQAADWWRKALGIAPELTEARERLLALYRDEQEPSEAISLLEELIGRTGPGARAALCEELGWLLQPLDPARAAEAFARAYWDQPTTHMHCALRAQQLYRQERHWEQARQLIDETLTRTNDGPLVKAFLLARARLLVDCGAPLEQLVAAFDAYLDLMPEDARVRGEYGQHLLEAGRAGEALPHLQFAADLIRAPVVSATAAFRAARALLTLGMDQQALQRLELCVERDPAQHDAWRQLAALQQRLGNHDAAVYALEVLKGCVARGGPRAAVCRQLAQLYGRLGRSSDASAALEEARAEAPDDPELLVRLYTLKREAGELKEAAALLRTRIAQAAAEETQIQLRCELAELLASQLGQPEQAREELRLAMAQHPDHVAPQLAMLTLLEQEGRLADAARLAQRLAPTQAQEERRELLLRSGTLWEASGDLDQAMSAYRSLGGDDPVGQRALALGRALAERADYQPERSSEFASQPGSGTHSSDWLVDQHLTKPMPASLEPEELVPSPAKEEDPRLKEFARKRDWQALVTELSERVETAGDPLRSARLQVQLATLLDIRLHRTKEAFERCSAALALAPHDGKVLMAAADLAYRRERWELADELLERLTKGGHLPLDAELRYRRGVVSEALDEPAEASRHYAEALAIEPKYSPALGGRVRLVMQQEPPDTAIRIISALLEGVPLTQPRDVADLRQCLGELHLRLGHLRDAKRYVEATLALDGNRQRALHLLLTIEEQLEDFVAAASLTERLVHLVDEPGIRASLLHHRAELMANHLGDEEEAIDCLLRAYDIAPNHTPTLWRLIDYYWSEGDFEAVAQMGDDLKEAQQLNGATHDLRLVHLAVAVMSQRKDLEAAAELLRPLLATEALRLEALAELASASAWGIQLEALVQLALKALPNPAAVPTPDQLAALAQPLRPEVRDLLTILGEEARALQS